MDVTNYLIDHRLPYGQIVAEYQDGLVSNADHTYGLERISQDRGGVVNFYFSDGQQSIRNLTDASGNITDSYSYYGFGDALSSSGNTDNSFRYVGEELNGFTDLYNLRARWYNQGDGRFVSVDPYAGKKLAPISLHRYLYANQSPVSMSDPAGEFTLSSVMAAISVSNILSANAIPKWVAGGQCRPLFISASHIGTIGDGNPRGQAFRHLRIRFHAAIRGAKENCVIEQFKKGTTSFGGGIYTDNIGSYESDGGEWWNGNTLNPIIESEAKWNGGVATFYDYPGIYNINELSLPAERSMQYLTIIRDKDNKQSCKKIYWGIEMFISSDGSGGQYFYTGR